MKVCVISVDILKSAFVYSVKQLLKSGCVNEL